MPKSRRNNKSGRKSKVDTALSTRTKKQIDSLPEHAQHIFKKAHANAIKEYQNPEKRRGGKHQSAEEVAKKTHGHPLSRNIKSKGINGSEKTSMIEYRLPHLQLFVF